MDTKVQKTNQFPKRERVINSKECKKDLEEVLPKLFNAFRNATSLYEEEVVKTPPEARGKGYEASLFNSKTIQSIQKEFGAKWFYGKYKRFILRLNGYIILFKKLGSNNMPMNIKTKLSSAITNQQQGNLFTRFEDGTEPIVFFGYKKDRFGVICDPQLIYIDENKLRWTITENEVEQNALVINIEQPATRLTLRQNRQNRTGTNY